MHRKITFSNDIIREKEGSMQLALKSTNVNLGNLGASLLSSQIISLAAPVLPFERSKLNLFLLIKLLI